MALSTDIRQLRGNTVNTLRQPATARRVLCGALLALAIVLLCAVPAAAQPRHMRILAPNGGEELAGSSLVTVRWSGTFAPTDTVAVEYSLDDGASWRLIRKVRGDTQVPWNVPFVNSTRCRVRATQVSGTWGTGDSTLVYRAPGQAGNAVTFSDDGKILVQADFKALRIFDAVTGALLRTVQLELGTDGGVVISPNNKLIAVRLRDWSAPDPFDRLKASVDVWSVETGERILHFVAPRPSDTNAKYYKDFINGLSFNTAGTRIVALANLSTTIWDLAERRQIDSIYPIGPAGLGLIKARYAPGDSLIYIVHVDVGVHIWDVRRRAFIDTISTSTTSGELTPDCRRFEASVLKDGKQIFTVFDLANNGKPYLSYTLPFAFNGKFMNGYAFLFGTRPGDTAYYIYDVTRQRLVHSITSFPARVSAWAVPPTGERFATVMSDDKRIILWRWDNTDSSDAAFTISSSGTQLPRLVIAPTPVGRLRDTTITAYITNSGSGPMNVDSLRISAGDTADFALTSGGGAFSLAPGASRALGIRFTPSRAGERTAWIELRAGGQTSVGELAGIGTRGRLVPLFDTMLIGTTKPDVPLERTVKLLWNGGDGPLRLDSVQLYGSSAYLFSVLDSGGVPKDLPPGDTFSIRVGFKWRNPSLHWCSVITYGDSGTTGFSLSRIFVRVEDAADAPRVDEGASGAIAGLSWRIRGLSPVPADEHLRAELRVLRPSRIGLRIVDAVGHVVLEREPEERAEGLWAVDLRVAALPPGAYLLQAVGDGGSETVRFVVVR